MVKAEDPYYNRKPVPDEFIEHVGDTGFQATEETEARERKFSKDGGDLRKFWNPKQKDGKLDPYYQRKPVPDTYVNGVGDTGLTKEEEYLSRERKYSVGGGDVRQFSSGKGSSMAPSTDPYYARKATPKAQLVGVGETGMTRAEEYEVQENKAAKVDFSDDPFQLLTGKGHRASISGAAAPVAAAAARRRSSAVAPDAEVHHYSGYDGNEKLALIESRQEATDQITPTPSTTAGAPPGPTGALPTATSTVAGASHLSGDPGKVGVRDDTGHVIGETGHTRFYEAATRDLDSVAPHEHA